MKHKTKRKHNDFKEFFVSFYKNGSHYVFYKLVHELAEVKAFISAQYGKVADLVIDQVI